MIGDVRLLSAVLALFVSAIPAGATPCALGAAPETVAVERALDGDTVALDDGRIVRLAGVSAPKPPLGAKAADWPLDGQARAGLERLAAGQVLELRAVEGSPDRRNRVIGHLSAIGAQDHAGVTVELLERGLLRVSGQASGRVCQATLVEAEGRAIGSRLGLWSEPYYEVQEAADGAALAALAGRFVVAEGRVASVRTSAGRAYVNFGARWRDALSLSYSEAALRRLGGFERLGVKAGVRLRARGVVEARLGPTIYVTHASQVDRLDDRKR